MRRSRLAEARFGGDQRGSVLMLVPAAVLVLVVLGAIAVDSAVVFLAQRDLANRTAAAANDIAGFALGDPGLYGAGEVALAQDRADAYMALAFDQQALPARFVPTGAKATVDGTRVEVRAEAEVQHLFASAVPGVRRTTVVRAVTTATAASQ